jgi:hypothetical protein
LDALDATPPLYADEWYETTKTDDNEERTADFFLVTLQDSELLHRANIEDSDGLISGGTGHEIAVW